MLPREYQQVEYLEGSGTQYVITNCGVELGQEIHAGFMLTAGNVNNPIYGASPNGTNCTTQGLVLSYIGTCFFSNYANSGSEKRHNFSNNVKYDIIAQRSTWVTINGIGWELQVYNTYTGDVPNQKIELFARGRRIDPNYLNGRIYYFYVLDSNGNKQCDIIPCYRKSDRKPGMYDTITKQFFTNSGTGEFIIGPET